MRELGVCERAVSLLIGDGNSGVLSRVSGSAAGWSLRHDEEVKAGSREFKVVLTFNATFTDLVCVHHTSHSSYYGELQEPNVYKPICEFQFLLAEAKNQAFEQFQYSIQGRDFLSPYTTVVILIVVVASRLPAGCNQSINHDINAIFPQKRQSLVRDPTEKPASSAERIRARPSNAVPISQLHRIHQRRR